MKTPAHLHVLTLALALAPCAAAQGGIAWPGWTAAPEVRLVQIDVNHVDVLVPGWVTTASSGLTGENVATGVGVKNTGVRTVDKSEFENEDSAAPMELAPLFPFATDLNVTSSLSRLANDPTLIWNGFLARVPAPIPGLREGTLTFRFSHPVGIDLDDFQLQLNGAMVVIAPSDASGNVQNGPRVYRFTLSRNTVVRPELLYYKFERGTGLLATNYVTEFSGAPRSGRITAGGWGAGRFGGGLRGGTATNLVSCDTRWHGGVHGSFTVAFFLRQANDPGGVASRICGGVGVRIFTGGPAGKRIRCEGLAGTKGPIDGPDISAAQTSWLHVAMVVETQKNGSVLDTRIQWYLDGKASGAPTVLANTTVGIAEVASATLALGAGNGLGCYHDLDEFRIVAATASATEVASYAAGPGARAASYRDSAGCVFATSGGDPKAGGKAFTLHVAGASGSPLAVVIGLPEGRPFPLGGGTWYVDPTTALVLYGSTDANGRFSLPTSIPTNLAGSTLHGQVYLAPRNGLPVVSRPLAISIE
ncbi:MAG: hypothetical protein KDC87_00045 [Planctomycetes bacterium]|nr:hypothetical protein [Planctomycetota bacterium]